MTQDLLITLSIAILLIPLLGFSILIFFGKRIGEKSAKAPAIIGTSFLSIAFILSCIVAFGKLTYYPTETINRVIDWFSLGTFSIKVGVGIDNLTVYMLLVVTLISSLVHLFSSEYMAGDKRYSRFYAYLGIFTFSMLGIVLGNNFLFMYIFWELVGLSSYLLIGFWYEKDSAANASKKAFLTNRVGDLGFFAGIMILYVHYNTFIFDDIFKMIGAGNLPFGSGTVLTVAGVLLFCGAVGKSAQFPLHVWLPDAMEGPTPVSALIHAATMVAAGVYLVARIFPMLSGDALTIIAYIGAFTAFLAATIAITQNDIKKVLAYSTVSQLGYMIMSLGCGAYTFAFFHLVTHAWFKAALFLGSGSVIHSMHHSAHHLHDHHSDVQDVRNMGGLRKTMPKTFYTFLFATIAISGIPLTSGFLSKDGILAGTLAFAQLSGHWMIPAIAFLVAGMTAFYMFRVTILTFMGKHKSKIAEGTRENGFALTFPLILLAVMSTWIFYSTNPFDGGAGWFAKTIKAPMTFVQAPNQRAYMLPEKAEAPEHTALAEVKLDSSKTEAVESHSAEGAVEHKTETIANDSKDSNKAEHIAIAENAEHKTEEAGVVKGEEHNKEIATEAHASAGAHGVLSHYANKFEEEMHHMHIPAMIASLVMALSGIFLAFFVFSWKLVNTDKFANQLSLLYNISYNKWYIDEIYEATAIAAVTGIGKLLALFDNLIIDGIVNGAAWLGRMVGWFSAWFDNTFVDGLVNFTATATHFVGKNLRYAQTGKIQTYLMYFVVATMLLIGIIGAKLMWYPN